MTSFNEHFDRHGAWRSEMGLRVKVLGDWLHEQDLLDDGAKERDGRAGRFAVARRKAAGG